MFTLAFLKTVPGLQSAVKVVGVLILIVSVVGILWKLCVVTIPYKHRGVRYWRGVPVRTKRWHNFIRYRHQQPLGSLRVHHSGLGLIVPHFGSIKVMSTQRETSRMSEVKFKRDGQWMQGGGSIVWQRLQSGEFPLLALDDTTDVGVYVVEKCEYAFAQACSQVAEEDLLNPKAILPKMIEVCHQQLLGVGIALLEVNPSEPSPTMVQAILTLAANSVQTVQNTVAVLFSSGELPAT